MADEDLFPIRSITYTDKEKCGAYGPVVLEMKDGRTVTVDYEGLEAAAPYKSDWQEFFRACSRKESKCGLK